MRSGIALLIGIITVWVASVGRPSQSAIGTDDAAVAQVGAISPAYRPWYTNPLSLAPELVPSGLVGQSAAGVVIFVLAVGGLRRHARRAGAPATGD